jgi:hypothetical protein
MAKKTEIEIEMSETVAYSSRSERFEAYCGQCGSLVEMVTPPVAAILAKTTEREIYRLIEANEIHFVESQRVIVCLTSLEEKEKGHKS